MTYGIIYAANSSGEPHETSEPDKLDLWNVTKGIAHAEQRFHQH